MTMCARYRRSVVVCLVVCAFLVIAPLQTSAQGGAVSATPLAAVALGAGQLKWQLLQPNEGVILRVSGPYGEVEELDFAPRETPTLGASDWQGQPRPDGVYTWELRARPILSPAVRQELVRARESGDETVAPRLRRMGMLPLQPLVQSGHFRVFNGQLVVGDGQAEAGAQPDSDGGLVATAVPTGELIARAADVVHADDVIVTNSMCIGFDCLTDGSENFGFDSLRFKENNIRIHFDDTSATSAFPLNDWRLVANDTADGGGEYFSLEDATNAKTPFKVEANAKTSALYVNTSGRVGLGTATPVLELHTLDGDTPAVRLDQDTSMGWTPQAWDVAGNESNFFIRDVTGGSRLPFRIGPNTPTDTLTLKSGGKVGVGTWSPTSPLHVQVGGTTDPVLMLDGTNATDSLSLKVRHPNGVVGFGIAGGAGAFFSTANQHDAVVYGQPGYNLLLGVGGSEWLRITNAGRIGIGQTAPAHPLHMASGAHVTTGGVWTNASSRSFKQNIESLESEEAAATLAALDPVKFEYKADPTEKHVGFIAEDVPGLLATSGRTGLSPMDIVAVLTKVVQQQQQTIAELQARVAQLETK
jgi:hypothetical protein